MPAGQRRHQQIIRHLVAEPCNHRGHLRVEQRFRHLSETQHENLDVLPGRVEHFGHRLIGQQQPEGREVEIR